MKRYIQMHKNPGIIIFMLKYFRMIPLIPNFAQN